VKDAAVFACRDMDEYYYVGSLSTGDDQLMTPAVFPPSVFFLTFEKRGK
jgi:hypothetical protein